MEKLLSVFDQGNISEDHHILNISKEDYPEGYRPLIRRLQRAIEEPKIRKTMDVEDEVLEEKDRIIKALTEKLKRKE